MLHETPRERLDLPFLTQRTASPYLVGPNGYYLRDRVTRKPLVWDALRSRACAHDTPGIDEALEGRCEVDAIEIGADDEVLAEGLLAGETGVRQAGRAHARRTRPSGRRASATCRRRRCAASRTSTSSTPASARPSRSTASTLPYRPVAVTLGKTVNNGWGGYECCWARTLLACAGRRARSARRHARHHGAPDPADVRAAAERQARARTASWTTR